MANEQSSGMTSSQQPADLASTRTAPALRYSTTQELQEYTIPFAQYIKQSPSFSKHPTDAKLAAATGSVVFCHNKTLLVQRAPTDSMPLHWETPGGACDDTDASILDAAARELWEETGFVATRMVRLLTKVEWMHRRVGCITKFVFEVEVAHDDGTYLPAVKLDPNEHCAYVWATKDEIEAGRTAEHEIKFTWNEVRDYILAGFAFHNDNTPA